MNEIKAGKKSWVRHQTRKFVEFLLISQDFEILRRIAGCQEFVARENFEKMWCWLYPVASTLSGILVNALWNSASPKWIEGFITKEEAESSLQGPGVLQGPGTFVLRFPTSRSWPHPDAGNLVATYIGSDYNIHHRLLSLDFIFRWILIVFLFSLTW